jgi:hypothetical protein
MLYWLKLLATALAGLSGCANPRLAKTLRTLTDCWIGWRFCKALSYHLMCWMVFRPTRLPTYAANVVVPLGFKHQVQRLI